MKRVKLWLEEKYFDIFWSKSLVPHDTVATFNGASDIAQGPKSDERIGDKIFVKWAELRFNFWAARPEEATVFGYYSFYPGGARIVVILDHQAFGTTASYYPDIMVASTVDSFVLPSEELRFEVLYDEYHHFTVRPTGDAFSVFLYEQMLLRVKVEINREFWFRPDDDTGADHVGRALLAYAFTTDDLRYANAIGRLCFVDQ